MKYLKITIAISPNEEYISDLLAAELAEIDFESFVHIQTGLEAYIPEMSFNQEVLENLVQNFYFDAKLTYKIESIEEKNWNEEWEKNFFEPILIENQCIIHSSFHKNIPNAKYSITIDPKMSFGTGHHETTSLMIGCILEMDLENKSVLDMGCGTAVLAILASMRRASTITAIDIDEWCVENSIENLSLNGIKNVEVFQGTSINLEKKKFDVVLANINRNILLADINMYSKCLTTGGKLIMSGFYKEDIPLIEAEANKHNIRLTSYKEKNNWVAVNTEKL
jgi:ribosomal protein L11 methyltransferase